MNTFLPGLGFAYSRNIFYLTLLGIVPVILIGAGIVFIFQHPYLTALFWIAGITLHLLSIYFSTKIKVNKASLLMAYLYGSFVIIFFILCFVRFFINLMYAFKINV